MITYIVSVVIMLGISAYGLHEMMKDDAPKDISLLNIILGLIFIFTPILNSVLALLFGMPLVFMFLEKVKITIPKKKVTK